jgi:hypothetical protein
LAAPRKTGARNSLGKEVDDLLADFSAATYGAPATQIIREAVEAHITARLEAEPALRARVDAARKKRLGSVPPKVVRLNPTI